jgi:hypothetical protein
LTKESKINPFCAVPGCKTKQRHEDDPVVQGLIGLLTCPGKLIAVVRSAMEELISSLENDLAANRTFAWLTRLRQPEEMYIRMLYVLFVADGCEVLHVLSGSPPNGMSALYKRVNEVVFEGRGELQAKKRGLNFGQFTPMDVLHNAAHGSFQALLTWLSIQSYPGYLKDFPQGYFRHLRTYCRYLAHIEDLFNAGREKGDVLAALTNLHRPGSYWKAEQERPTEAER